jgi:hypothetical protein
VKRVVLVLIAVVLISVSAQAEEESSIRIGVSLGGTHLLGLSLEYHHGRYSIELGIGSAVPWELQDLILRLQVRGYLASGDISPYLGIGFWGLFAFPADGFGYLGSLNAPVGIDWGIGGGSYLRLEADLNYFVYVNWAGGDQSPSLNTRFLLLPAFAYQHKF